MNNIYKFLGIWEEIEFDCSSFQSQKPKNQWNSWIQYGTKYIKQHVVEKPRGSANIINQFLVLQI